MSEARAGCVAIASLSVGFSQLEGSKLQKRIGLVDEKRILMDLGNKPIFLHRRSILGSAFQLRRSNVRRADVVERIEEFRADSKAELIRHLRPGWIIVAHLRNGESSPGGTDAGLKPWLMKSLI